VTVTVLDLDFREANECISCMTQIKIFAITSTSVKSIVVDKCYETRDDFIVKEVEQTTETALRNDLACHYSCISINQFNIWMVLWSSWNLMKGF
jgi:hypothetical protein